MLRSDTRTGGDSRIGESMRCVEPGDLPMSVKQMYWARELRRAIVEDVIRYLR